jgi:hypothetical protein
MDAAGESDLYKVDILKAMRWCKAAWHMVAPNLIKNCWRHSGVCLTLGTLSDRASSAESDETDALLADKIAQLNIQCPFSVDELIQIDSDIAPFDEVS